MSIILVRQRSQPIKESAVLIGPNIPRSESVLSCTIPYPLPIPELPTETSFVQIEMFAKSYKYQLLGLMSVAIQLPLLHVLGYLVTK